MWIGHTLCVESPERHKDQPVDTDLSQEHCPSAENAGHEYSGENTSYFRNIHTQKEADVQIEHARWSWKSVNETVTPLN